LGERKGRGEVCAIFGLVGDGVAILRHDFAVWCDVWKES
jgi:hypothetical protein